MKKPPFIKAILHALSDNVKFFASFLLKTGKNFLKWRYCNKKRPEYKVGIKRKWWDMFS